MEQSEDVDVPERLRAGFEQRVAELGGAPVPGCRSSRCGRGRSRPSCGTGDVWFKATMLPYFGHEPAITDAIGMPRVLRLDRERGWMLMEQVDGDEGSDHHGALRAIAAIHRSWTNRVDEALALGAHDRRAPSPLPHTLIHGDFHPWNVLGATIVDWSDAAVANPLHNVPEERRYELLDTYSAAWGDDVAAEADACEAETYEYIAQSYAQITAALAPDDRWVFAGAEARWLARASDVRAGKRPSRDM